VEVRPEVAYSVPGSGPDEKEVQMTVLWQAAKQTIEVIALVWLFWRVCCYALKELRELFRAEYDEATATPVLESTGQPYEIGNTEVGS
jgi:hypothetical protein